MKNFGSKAAALLAASAFVSAGAAVSPPCSFSASAEERLSYTENSNVFGNEENIIGTLLAAAEHEHTFSNGWAKDKDYHWHPANCGHDTVNGKEAHKWDGGRVTTEPTDKKEGVVTYTCEVCGAQKAELIPTADKEPTEERHIHVASMEWSADETGHWHNCTGCAEKYDFAEHSENNGVVTVRPTENSEGEITYRCRICGAVTRTEILPAGYDTADDSVQQTEVSDVQPAEMVMQSDENLPEIAEESHIKGWEAISEKILYASDGETVSVNMNNASELPKSVIEAFAGRNVNLAVKMKNGVKWTINGENVTSPRSVNLGVVRNARTHIPKETLKVIGADGVSTKQLSLDYNGEFGFTGTLTVNFGKKYNDFYANAFSYDRKSKELELTDSSPIENGSADMDFSHASEYAVVISEVPLESSEDVAVGGGVILPSEKINVEIKKTSPYRKYAYIAAALAAGITVVSVIKKRIKE